MASESASRPSPTAWVRRPELLLDAGIALVVFALSVALLAARGTDAETDTRSLDALGVAIAAVASLPLVARRRAPLAVFAVTAGASALLMGLGYPPGPPLGPTVALYFLALRPDKTHAPRWLTAAVVGGLFAIHVSAVGFAEEGFPTVPLLLGIVVWGAAWVVGDGVRLRRERLAGREERARRAELESERRRRLAVAEERARIARDLHDSAGHAINVILVQAGAARLLSKHDPEGSQAALETIEDVARETLGEIDQMVRVLRDDDLPAEETGNVEPPLGLAALETLVARHRSAGLAVDVERRGARRPLSPGLDRAAYRILQEALTNAARHGEGSARVEIGFGPHALELAVTNPTRIDGESAGEGHGIVGMRERATLLGGTLEAGASDGYFRVRADLPYGGDSA